MTTLNQLIFKLLDAREKRAHYQQALLTQFQQTLIVIKCNYPGVDKHHAHTAFLVTDAYFKIKEYVTISQYFMTCTQEGLIYYLLTPSLGDDIKSKMIHFEETHPLGRLLDIDVYDVNQQYHRAMYQKDPRQCLMCEMDAKVCARQGTHQEAKIQNKIKDMVTAYIVKQPFEQMCAHLTVYGLIYELSKPIGCGCVGIGYDGSHHDMDAATFICSIEAIANSMLNFPSQTNDFNQLRLFGKTVEKAMFVATKGINTHKGAIFIFILLYAAIKESCDFNKIQQEIKILCKDILNDFNQQEQTNGHKIYAKYQKLGIRGEANRGFETLFNACEVYQETQDATQLFLYILAHLEDTTLIHRGSLDHLNTVKQLASRALNKEGTIQDIDKYCLQHGLSCGGSADMLAAVMILDIIKTKGYT